MKTAMRTVTALVVMALMLSCLAVPAMAVSSPPYLGYTYDPYGVAAAAPIGYVPDSMYDYRDMGTTKITNPSDMLIYKDNIYISDKGNDRIVVLDADFKFVREIKKFVAGDGTEYKIESPNGIFIRDDELFVTCSHDDFIEGKKDRYKNGFILSGMLDGKFVRILRKPTDSTVKINGFEPLSIVTDKSGYLYVRCYNILEGLVIYEPDGTFSKYYGANPVTMTWQLIVERVWKSIFSREAADQLQKAVPTEMSNIFIDNEDFIYTSTSSSAVSESLRIRKLSSEGKNILGVDPNALVKTVFGDRQIIFEDSVRRTTLLVDLHVDDDGIIAALDSRRGRVFLYDQLSTLITVFGASGTQLGATKSAVAIDKLGDRYVVLDGSTGAITTYYPTDYIDKLLTANDYYLKGQYAAGEEYWREVLRYDSNNPRGYAAIGKALLEKESYSDALEYLQKGEDRVSYSRALSEYRKNFLRANIYWLVPVVVVILIVIIMLYRKLRTLLGLTNSKRKIKFN